MKCAPPPRHPPGEGESSTYLHTSELVIALAAGMLLVADQPEVRRASRQMFTTGGWSPAGSANKCAVGSILCIRPAQRVKHHTRADGRETIAESVQLKRQEKDPNAAIFCSRLHKMCTKSSCLAIARHLGPAAKAALRITCSQVPISTTRRRHASWSRLSRHAVKRHRQRLVKHAAR